MASGIGPGSSSSQQPGVNGLVLLASRDLLQGFYESDSGLSDSQQGAVNGSSDYVVSRVIMEEFYGTDPDSSGNQQPAVNGPDDFVAPLSSPRDPSVYGNGTSDSYQSAIYDPDDLIAAHDLLAFASGSLQPAVNNLGASIATRDHTASESVPGPSCSQQSALDGSGVLAAPLDPTAASAGCEPGPSGIEQSAAINPQIPGVRRDNPKRRKREKKYQCEKCGKLFITITHLNNHDLTHTNVRKYECRFCDKKIKQLSHLKQHMLGHFNQRPYKCTHPGCKNDYAQLANLQRHARVHETDKPYWCRSCSKCFADESSLISHVPIHEKTNRVRTTICKYCGKPFNGDKRLARHLRRHTKEQREKCKKKT